MIYKKKILKITHINLVINYLRKFIFFLGSLSLILILTIILYYYSSGLHKTYSPISLLFKINDVVLSKYLGFDLKKTGTYFEIIKLNIFKNFNKNDLENVYLKLDQETIYGIELQRKQRSESGGELNKNQKVYLPAVIKFGEDNYRVKIRTKGVRPLHWEDKNTTSYKIDLRGDKRLWGMEEFSLQKPITRNYTYEYIFHKLLADVFL